MNSGESDGARNVEAMRGIAAMVVAYFHCRVIAWVGIRHYLAGEHAPFSLDTVLAYLTIPLVWGAIGVPIFFVISGYCIHRSHAARLARNPLYRPDAGDFLLRRFIRIYPVLFFALLLTFALDSFSANFWPHNERLGDLGLRTFAGNLLALQGITVPTYGSNGALWTLSLEIQFYALYPLLFAVRRRIGANGTLCALMLLAAASYALFEQRGIIVFTSYWAAWYLGAWVAERDVRGARPAGRRVGAAAFVLLALGCAAPVQYFQFQIWALAFAPLLSIMVRARARRTLVMRALEKVGEFSYSLYIVHIPIYVALVSWQFRSIKPDTILWSLEYFFIALACAYVFHLLVERPAISVLRRLSRRRTAPRSPLSAPSPLPLDERG
ncbi:peptidoglycan/LPS O-acetylase OafA/YrhL [Paraburkholderia unamae]|uniref:acyltransferase family protein n=1 Tax=Paraburkholderia unamae TaxID=219649 RepID=UPI000DC27948|nr:acyltransferase [Paraburkholderia unamae]RAR60563.1 peptidoglycan/LPS O-acetylase OafA/YrhL [Paraburkholderia unamae]